MFDLSAPAKGALTAAVCIADGYYKAVEHFLTRAGSPRTEWVLADDER